MLDENRGELRFGPGTSFAVGRAQLFLHPLLDKYILVFDIVEDELAEFERVTDELAGSQVGIFFEGELITGPAILSSLLPGGGTLEANNLYGWTEEEARAWEQRLWGGQE